MENITNVASWFLSQASMTHKKLQKLCYYAQAWHYTLYKRPLFCDDIQAWVHGPVIASLYPAYADYKWNSIPQKEFDESLLSPETVELLNTVYNTYGDYSGEQLEALSHSEEPWKKTRGELKPWETCTAVIPLDEMGAYYGKIYEDAQND